MKTVFALCLLFSINAQAAVCGQWVKCATYQAVDERITDRKVIREVLIQEGSAADKLIVEFATIDGERKTTSRAELTFRDNGSFFTMRDGEVLTAGSCKYMACTFSTPPREHNEELIQEAAAFRFVDNALQFHKFVVKGDGKAHNSTITFTEVL